MENRTRTITCKELSIEPESLQDAKNIYEYMGCDSEITRYTGWNPYQTLEATIAKIENDLSSDDGSYSWVIKRDGEFVGTIGAYDYNPDDSSIEIGYSIARDFWGNGYAGKATQAVVDFLLSEPHIKVVRAWSHKDNIASKKILLGLGFAETEINGDQVTYELADNTL